jgi:uncharacterized protein (DUF4415 family)
VKNEERISIHTSEELKAMNDRGEDQSDRDYVRSLTDEELEASIDFEEEGYPDWSTVRVGAPPAAKKQITVRFDPDLIEWFKGQGPGYQTRMNAVLRSYMLAKAK